MSNASYGNCLTWLAAPAVVLVLGGASAALADPLPDGDEMRESVVRIIVETDKGMTTGTGFIINNRRAIATNSHIVGDAKTRANATLDQRERELKATPEEKLTMEQERGAQIDDDFDAVEHSVTQGGADDESEQRDPDDAAPSRLAGPDHELFGGKDDGERQLPKRQQGDPKPRVQQGRSEERQQDSAEREEARRATHQCGLFELGVDLD